MSEEKHDTSSLLIPWVKEKVPTFVTITVTTTQLLRLLIWEFHDIYKHHFYLQIIPERELYSKTNDIHLLNLLGIISCTVLTIERRQQI